MHWIQAMAIAGLCMPAIGLANPMLAHQGRILDSSGEPLQTSVALRISLYDTVSITDSFWTRLYPDTTLQDGYYAVALVLDDDENPLPIAAFEDHQTWVGVDVNGVSIAPRQQLASTPYAIVSGGVQLPDRAVGACDEPGSLYWDSAQSRLHVCNGTTSILIDPAVDVVGAVEADSGLDLSGDVAFPSGNVGASVGRFGFMDQTVFAICATRHDTFRYLESPGNSQTCSQKCADNEKPGNSCLGSVSTGGNESPFRDYGCGYSSRSLGWCCCSW